MKLSVAIITYNHERFIRKALEGVLAQRVNFEYEIVVGEDCSTDETRNIVIELSRANPLRIVPLLQDKNVGGARNLIAVLNVCRGEYLAVLEGDDYWTCENKLQKQVDFLEQHRDYALCCHRAQLQDETGQGQTGVLLPPPHFVAGPYTINDLIASNFIATCTVMYRSDSLGPVPKWFVEIIPGDWARHILAARSGKIQLLDEVMSVYRIHSEGAWTSQYPLDQKSSLIQMMNNLDRHTKFKYTRDIRRQCAGLYFEMANLERMRGNRVAAMKHLIGCVRAGRWRLPARFIDWASLLGFGLLGVARLRWWKAR